MNKVICDICGTSYPETAEQCPICGYSRDSHIEPLAEGEEFLLGDDLDLEEEIGEEELFAEEDITQGLADELDTENADADADDDDEVDEDDEDDEDEKRPSALLIVLLVIVIIALIGVAGFIFVKYYLPGMNAEETVPETTVAVVETVETTTPTVPCTSLAMTSDSLVTLEQPGNNWLINVVAMPEDTTDVVTFSSSDESVATVDSTGLVTAVGEGQAVITVSCGEYKLTCDVICAFVQETTVPDVTEPETETPSETATETGTENATETATEAATEAPTEAPTEAATEPASDLVLKLNKKDITFNKVNVRYVLKITEGIDPADVEWISTNGGVCFAVDGVLNVVGYGQCTIIARYEGQEVSCIIRVTRGDTSGTSASATPAPTVAPATE